MVVYCGVLWCIVVYCGVVWRDGAWCDVVVVRQGGGTIEVVQT